MIRGRGEPSSAKTTSDVVVIGQVARSQRRAADEKRRGQRVGVGRIGRDDRHARHAAGRPAGARVEHVPEAHAVVHEPLFAGAAGGQRAVRSATGGPTRPVRAARWASRLRGAPTASTLLSPAETSACATPACAQVRRDAAHGVAFPDRAEVQLDARRANRTVHPLASSPSPSPPESPPGDARCARARRQSPRGPGRWPSRCRSRQQRLSGVAVMSKAPSVAALRCSQRSSRAPSSSSSGQRAIGGGPVDLTEVAVVAKDRPGLLEPVGVLERLPGGGHVGGGGGGQQHLEPAGHGLAEDPEEWRPARALGRDRQNCRLERCRGPVPTGLGGACGVVGVGAQLVRSGHKNLEVDFPNMIYDAS